VGAVRGAVASLGQRAAWFGFGAPDQDPQRERHLAQLAREGDGGDQIMPPFVKIELQFWHCQIDMAMR
jgi:hypothetical protein